jgi:hypothetical protein
MPLVDDGTTSEMFQIDYTVYTYRTEDQSFRHRFLNLGTILGMSG